MDIAPIRLGSLVASRQALREGRHAYFMGLPGLLPGMQVCQAKRDKVRTPHRAVPAALTHNVRILTRQ